jgi:hypothetical protein
VEPISGKGPTAVPKIVSFGWYHQGVTFHLSPKAGGRAATKQYASTTGDVFSRCGDVNAFSVPPQSSLCSWTDPTVTSFLGGPPQAGFSESCGKPILKQSGATECAALGPPVLHGSTVDVGAFACSGGRCVQARESYKPKFFGLPLDADGSYMCNSTSLGWIGVDIAIWTVRLVDMTGATCEWSAMNHPTAVVKAPISKFSIPTSWSGTLYVTFALNAAFNPSNEAAKKGAPAQSDNGVEFTTAVIPLKGSGAGCSAFQP